MNLYNEETLKRHYSHILEQNKEILLKGGHRDPFLMLPKTDARMAVALLIRVKGEVSERLRAGDEKAEPKLYYYPTQDFHITVVDILRGRLYCTLPERTYIS